MLTASKPIVRSTASRPSVITATENSGSPTIGRMTSRSMTSPSTAVNNAAEDDAEIHDHVGAAAQPTAGDVASR